MHRWAAPTRTQASDFRRFRLVLATGEGCTTTVFAGPAFPGVGSPVACDHASMGEANHSRDSNLAGAFMAFPWLVGGVAGRFAR